MGEPKWHPFMATEERSPGVWTLVDSMGRDYGEVRIVRIGSEVGYVGSLRGTPVGRWTTLRVSLENVHLAFIRDHAPGGFAPNPWPTTGLGDRPKPS
ncbi:hypothetical protein SAMN05443544_0594 [Agromyces cerinus subsp. cerinus]|uniref:Uncharacterized protein n=1 Tax=Agromyces cerinus subsp. cerinus TaxID=232089 RepID=A0A1N6DQA9_9MICO|nr:hypothetical protein SAMN05443544_0594 [Agromyces cerinus subsp. cerinus]